MADDVSTMKEPRVLVVLTSNARRGAEIEGSRLASELQGLGVDAQAVCLAPATGASVLDLPVLGAGPLAVSTLRALRRRARQCDVVIAFGSSTLPACALALTGTGVPFVYRSIGDPGAWVRGRLHRWRTGVLMRRATHVVALWPGAATSLRALYGVDPGRLSVIPNARSSDEFRPPTAAERAEARAQLGLPTDALVVGGVGSISHEKRLDLAVDAIARLNDVHLLVVGDGPGRAEIERHARTALGGRATLAGVLDDVTPAYRAIDALLLTSRTEGMPGVMIEAAMSGVPIVATDVGAVRSMFDTGIDGEVLAADASPDDVSSVIERVLRGRNRSEPAGTDAFEWRNVARSWNEVLHRYATDDRTVKVLAVMDSTGGGGAELSMAGMAPLLAQHGVEIEVAYFHDRSGAKEKFETAGIPLIHVPPGRNRLATVWRLRRVIRDRQPDVVHTMVYEADIIGRTAAFTTRTPVISSIINEMYGPEQIKMVRSTWKLWLAQVTDISTAKFVTVFHAITNSVADVMAPRLRIDRSKIVVIYRGRDFEQLGKRTPERRAAIRDTLGIGEHTPLLLAVGRHEPQKGHDLTIAALPAVLVRYPDAVLLIAGRDGSGTPELQDLVEHYDLADHVRFLGHRTDVPDLLAAADVMVFPSRWEGLGGAALEATLMGVPLVCSDLPVLRELASIAGVQESTSFVPMDHPDALALALVDALRADDRGGLPLSPALELKLEAASRAHANLYRSVRQGAARPLPPRNQGCSPDLAHRLRGTARGDKAAPQRPS
jgi:glycosyltransferase involved in cell wall biosynthesis